MQRPALQLALDGTLEQAKGVLALVAEHVDRIEVGTPLVVREGMQAVRVLRTRHPNLPLVADLKIMDAGEEEAEIAFTAGADEVTVLAVADDATVRGAVQAARRHGKRVLADLIQAQHPAVRGAHLLTLGADLLAVHTASDTRQHHAHPYGTLGEVRAALPDAALAVAGGIDAAGAARVLAQRPAVVIVGSAITTAADPRAAARQIREALG